MKKLVMVLGFCGAMVSSAGAGERWPTNVCKDIATLRTILEKNFADDRATARFGLLLLQRDRCGVDVAAALEVDKTLLPAARPMKKPADPAPRQPMLCDTTPKAYGGSYTDCF